MANPALADSQVVEDKKTGKTEKKTSVWVRIGGMQKSNFEKAADSRLGSKSFSTKDTSSSTLQAIERRTRGFANGPISIFPFF